MFNNILIQCAPNQSHHLHVLGIVEELAKNKNCNLYILCEKGFENYEVFRHVVSKNKNVNILSLGISYCNSIELFMRGTFRKLLKGSRKDSLIPILSAGSVKSVFDAVILTDLISGTKIKKHFENEIKVIWVMHGAVSNGYISSIKPSGVDLILVCGKTTKEAINIIQDNIYVVGSVKLEYCIKSIPPIGKQSLFKNHNHTFLYNPHYNPKIGATSWYSHGVEVLDYFSTHTNINLIFSPHPYLSKKLSGKLEGYSGFKNIIIDLDGVYSSTLAYREVIDSYIGDISSHALEYMFLNKASFYFHSPNITSKESSLMHSAGIVFKDFFELKNILDKDVSLSNSFKIKQRKYIENVFAEIESPSKEAAKKIFELINKSS